MPKPRASSKKKGAALRARTTADVQVTTSAIREYETALRRALHKPVGLFFAKLFKSTQAALVTRSSETPSAAQIARAFQEALQGIPDWSQERVDRVTDSIRRRSKIKHLQNVLSAVITQRVMVLCSVRTQDQAELEVEIGEPTLASYVHQVLIQAASALFRYPTLLLITDATTEHDMYTRQKTFDEIVGKAIVSATNECVPVDSLVGTYLEEAMGAREFETRREEMDHVKNGAQRVGRMRIGHSDDADSILGEDAPLMEVEKGTRSQQPNIPECGAEEKEAASGSEDEQGDSGSDEEDEEEDGSSSEDDDEQSGSDEEGDSDEESESESESE